MDAETYTYQQVADRIEAVFGARPSLSTLRAAGAKSSSGTDARVRITAAMPEPVSRREGGTTLFDQEEIERWLEAHPRRVQHQSVQVFEKLLQREGVSQEAVAFARGQGLSWEQIRKAISSATGEKHSKSSLHARFRHLPADHSSE